MKRAVLDTRALIFYVFGVVALVLLIPCPEDFHWVGLTVSSAYFVLGMASWLDKFFRSRS